MTKKVWEKGEEGPKMLVEYVKNIGLYYGHQDSNRNEEKTKE
jgi:hypothetical protein